MKLFKKYLLILILVFMSTIIVDVKAEPDIVDFSGSSSATLNSSSTCGSWCKTCVGLKVTVYTNGNFTTRIFLESDQNGNDYKNTHFHSRILNSKVEFNEKSKDSWVEGIPSNYSDYFIIDNSLVPEKWEQSENKAIELGNYLEEKEFSQLKKIIKRANFSYNENSYIIIEPMTIIEGYFGTAYELYSLFPLSIGCGNNNTFKNHYQKQVFGGTPSVDGGVFYKTIFVDKTVSFNGKTFSLYESNGCNANWHDENACYMKRNNCLGDPTCGRGLGIYGFNEIYGSIDLTITKIDSSTNQKLSNAGFTLYSDSSCSEILQAEQMTDSNGTITFNDLIKGNTYYYKETTAPTGYNINNTCHKINKIDDSNNNPTVYNSKIPSNGGIVLNIKDKSSKQIISNPNIQNDFKYELHQGNDCLGTVIKVKGENEWSPESGLKTISSLTTGIYSIKEIRKPTIYHSDYSSTCVAPSISVQAPNATRITLEYYQDCDRELTMHKNNGTLTVQLLLDMFKRYEYNNRGLLNFEDPSCTVEPSECSTNNSIIKDCLVAQTNDNNFGFDNMACYDDIIKTNNGYGDIIGFCKDELKLQNNLGVSKFYSYSGRFLIEEKQDSNNDYYLQIFNEKLDPVKITTNKNYIASLTSQRVCYILENENIDEQEIKSATLIFNEELPYDISDKHSVTYTTRLNGFKKYVASFTNNYKLNTKYIEKISGAIYDNIPIGKSYKSVNGLISKFNDKTGIIPFSIYYDGTTYNSDSCLYETTNQLIEYPQDKAKLNLEFRIIDTTVPFPDRNPKSNWSNPDDVTNKIINAVNSYGITPTSTGNTPKYSIRLTPDDIRIIRNYNKSVSYDNYRYVTYESLDENNNKISKVENAFIYSLSKDKGNGVLATYKNNTQKIEIDKTYGTLSNPLIIN